MGRSKIGYKNFRLKFQISQTTNFSPSIVREEIFARLKDKKYLIEEATSNKVIFGRELFELVWNFEAPYILDGGSFEIIESEKGTTVILSYFIKTLYTLLFFIAFIIFIISKEAYYAIFFVTTFYLLVGFSQFFITKRVGEKLLRDILTKENN